MNQENQKKIQEKYLELQVLNSQIRQINQELSLLDSQLIEVKRVEENLEDLKEVKLNTELLTSLGPGIFIKTNLKDNKEILVNIGVDVVIKKDIDSAMDYVKKQGDKIESVIKEIEQELNRININGEKLQEELNTLMKEDK